MVYLNTTEEGGATFMPNIEKRFYPEMGKALIWNSLNKDGSTNYDTLHAGEPPTKGEKYIITKWFREKGCGNHFIRKESDLRPNYTRYGFEKRKIPKELWEILLKWYNERKDKFQKENDIFEIKNKDPDKKVKTEIIHLTDDIKKEVDTYMKDILEDWSQTKLVQTSVYGIRSYLNGTFLDMHTDTANTHVISVIFHVDDKSTEPWPLHIVDNYNREHDIYFEKGDMVLYESARCRHGRPKVFNGDFFRNVKGDPIKNKQQTV